MNNLVNIFFILFIIIYLIVLFGLLYLSYSYIKYINNLEKTGCKCSDDIKRDMIKNFSYIILGSWVLLIIAGFVTPPKGLKMILNSKYLYILNLLFVGVYGGILFLYSKKLIDESCICSDTWVREAMQYHSYIYISLSIISFLLLLIKLLIGGDTREIYKLLHAMKNIK